MKNYFLLMMFLLAGLFNVQVFSQTKEKPVSLGLPGDNLDLYAVLDIFQKSKTIEDFEIALNSDESKINNLDLDNDKRVDFIKVITEKDGESFAFILQIAVSKTENQDVAVIFVNKDEKGKVTMQIVGDEDLYGKDYVIEPKESGTGSTANPGYTGGNPETMNLPDKSITTTTVVVQTAPMVQYIYSPVYVPYVPPYYYGFYPLYFRPWSPLMFSLYWSNHFHYHYGYYGGYYGHVHINIIFSRKYNYYWQNNRRISSTVSYHNRRGDYKYTYQGKIYARPSNRPAKPATRPSIRPVTKPTSPSTRPATRPSTRPATKPTSPSTRPATRPSTRPATKPTGPSARPVTKPARPSAKPATKPANRSVR